MKNILKYLTLTLTTLTVLPVAANTVQIWNATGAMIKVKYHLCQNFDCSQTQDVTVPLFVNTEAVIPQPVGSQGIAVFEVDNYITGKILSGNYDKYCSADFGGSPDSTLKLETAPSKMVVCLPEAGMKS